MAGTVSTQVSAKSAGVKGMQIGLVAERSGLSLRTIRYYEEEGLVTPSTRTAGGFRLYTEADCDRLCLIKQVKPLGFTLDEMRDLLHVLDRLAAPSPEDNESVLMARLDDFTHISEERCEQLREQLATAAQFADTMRQKLTSKRLRGGK